jgi:hypothetical protein
MKRIVSGLMIVVWLATIVGGCQTKSPSGADQSKGSGKPDLTTAPPDLEATIAEFDLSVANVKVKEFSSDPEQGKIWVNVRLAWVGGEVSRNVITFSSHTTENAWDGASVRLGDENGNLLWEYALDWDVNDTTWVRITERTDIDVLSIKKFAPVGMINTEVYEFNGTQKSFTYPQYLTDAQLNRSTTGLTEEDQALLEELKGEFQSFYNLDNSLSENRNGELLTQLLIDDGFRLWLETTITMNLAKAVPNRTALEMTPTERRDLICNIATVCAFVKCFWLVNPLCVPCTGIGLACAIAGIARKIFGID